MHSFNMRDPRFLKALVTGIEEGLVLTVGLLCGVAIAGLSGSTIVLVGSIFVFTGGVSIASRYALEHVYALDGSMIPRGINAEALMILLFYVLAGLVPLLPYMLMEVSAAFSASVVGSFALAFILGLLHGHKGTALWKSAWHMAYVAAGGAVIGSVVHAVLS